MKNKTKIDPIAIKYMVTEDQVLDIRRIGLGEEQTELVCSMSSYGFRFYDIIKFGQMLHLGKFVIQKK